MSSLASDHHHWELRAKEARELAESIADPVAKQAMLDIAANYEKIAKRAEAREANVAMPGERARGAL